MITHPAFKQKFKDLKIPALAKLANRFLSMGGIAYYLNDENYSSRVVLYNYCALLANGDSPAEWTIKLYSPDGKRVLYKKGTFTKQELVVLDLKDENIQSPFGLVVVHIKPLDGAKILGKVYDTVFFTEHYHRQGTYNDVAHSLRWLTPLKHYYEAIGHAFSVIPGAEVFLLVANSYDRAINFPRFYTKAKIYFINHRGEEKVFETDKIPSKGCVNISLSKAIPDLDKHMENKPGLIKVTGINIMRRPFFYQTNGKFISSDHL